MNEWLPSGGEIRMLDDVEPFYGFEVPASEGVLRCGKRDGWCPMCELEKRMRRPRLFGFASFVGLGVEEFLR